MYKIKDWMNYTESHLWVSVDGTKAVIGITDYGQNDLGTVESVRPIEVGAEVVKGDEICSIETIIDSFSINSPLSGTIIATNELLDVKPEFINEMPYNNGWLIELEISNSSEVDDLLDAKAYEKLTEGFF